MTILTDVPQSGIYFQKGAIVQIIAQILDVNTGQPVQLQTATGLTISILYPDCVTSQSFTAHLYTDGSDGMIAYTTINNGTEIDLSQIGLYQMQGQAAIGGVVSVLSYETDFYVLANVFSASSPTPQFTPSALILFDSNGVRWAQGVTPSGLGTPFLQPSGPASFLYFNQLVMQDSDGLYWTVTISTAGVIQATPGGSFQNALKSLLLSDINGKSWVATMSTNGTLQAA